MTRVNPVLHAFDDAITALDAEIKEREVERDRLVALRTQTAGLAPYAPVGGGKRAASVRRLTKGGKQHLANIADLLQAHGELPVAQIRDMTGAGDALRYLRLLKREGLAEPTEHRATAPGRRSQRTSPVWRWTGAKAEVEAEAGVEPAVEPRRPEQPERPKAAAKKRRRQKKHAPLGSVQTAVQAYVQTHSHFTKASAALALPDLSPTSVSSELGRLANMSPPLIEKTGRTVPSPSGHKPIPEYRRTTAAERLALPSNGGRAADGTESAEPSPAAAEAREVRITREGIEQGRLR